MSDRNRTTILSRAVFTTSSSSGLAPSGSIFGCRLPGRSRRSQGVGGHRRLHVSQEGSAAIRLGQYASPGPLFVSKCQQLLRTSLRCVESTSTSDHRSRGAETITEEGRVALFRKAFGLLQPSAVYGQAARDLITTALAMT